MLQFTSTSRLSSLTISSLFSYTNYVFNNEREKERLKYMSTTYTVKSCLVFFPPTYAHPINTTNCGVRYTTYSPIRRLAGTTLGSPGCMTDDGVASGLFILLAWHDTGNRRNTCTMYSVQSHGAVPTNSPITPPIRPVYPF